MVEEKLINQNRTNVLLRIALHDVLSYNVRRDVGGRCYDTII